MEVNLMRSGALFFLLLVFFASFLAGDCFSGFSAAGAFGSLPFAVTFFFFLTAFSDVSTVFFGVFFVAPFPSEETPAWMSASFFTVFFFAGTGAFAAGAFFFS
ncbi:hypothetical protein FYJ74_04505 [Pyramidobacter sp. SM-530-WT-4B]|uniref:Uncharacterized protein n=1 Tax=Pyramidobacter porci TaxID=2605789 RepID=A0A6L5YAG8_9BACT|nr:hypothetical protein [Pyramidobacter porci]MCI6260495.1 hypothetical protein [Pyramidobacter sp.]MDY2648478.1 hypothetical protein [Pyramidobacter porci]MST55294.1 hypothetical protein [Pyramidobacter porci]